MEPCGRIHCAGSSHAGEARGSDQRTNRMNRLIIRYGSYLGLLTAAAALPYLVTSASSRLVAITALLYALLAASWNLTLGISGIFNFAHVGFFGLGGYAAAISVVSWGWDAWAGLLLGGAVGSAAGALAYLPVVRMRGIYIALITFVFVQLCYYLILAVPGLTGGSSGLPGLRSLGIGSFSLHEFGGLGYLWLVGFAVALLLIALDSVLRSSFGRSLVALRDNEQFAVSRGISRVRQQMLAFVLSGGIAGVSGALYVSYFRVADTSLFSFGFVTLGLSMIFLGGTGHIWGPVVGAIVVTLIDRQLSDLGSWRQIIIGGGTILVLIFLPRGIAGLMERGAVGLRRLVPGAPVRYQRSRDTAIANTPVTANATEGEKNV
ncbi:branched-chain amino acid ABC transporter permease [Microbacterium sp. H83]|uniref:branched-chain amino acid ABC transporter permease n=2 Tax=Microbacteriaceae TaxID=85023 RepID=UPI0018D46F42|nr:branched-chain amino acid ABC transporter permease [Microbacterium sp. H83]